MNKSNIDHLRDLKNEKVLVDVCFYQLIELGWKYDLEESDMFIKLSKTFWNEGIKVSLEFDHYCCVPPESEITLIKDLKFYTFTIGQYPKRDITILFNEMQNDPFNTWNNVDQYMAHLETNYPLYIPYADFNTGLGCDDDGLLDTLNLNDVPKSVLENVIEDIKTINNI